MTVSTSNFRADERREHAEIVYATVSGVRGVPNPRKIVNAGDWLVSLHSWARLLELGDGGSERGQIAESWHRSLDGLRWKFDLKPNLRWSDGSPMTAGQVATSLNESANGTAHTQIQDYLSKIYLEGDRTIVVELRQHPENFLGTLAFADFSIVEPGEAFSNSAKIPPKTSGPYYFDRTSIGEVSLVINPYFAGARAKKPPQRAKVLGGLSTEQVLEMVRNGTADVARFPTDGLTADQKLWLEGLSSVSVFHSSPEWLFCLKAGKHGMEKFSAHNRRWLMRGLWERLAHRGDFGIDSATGIRPRTRSGSLSEREWGAELKRAPQSSEGRKPVSIDLMVWKTFAPMRAFQALLLALKDMDISVKVTQYDLGATGSSELKKFRDKDYDFVFTQAGVDDPDPDTAWRYLMTYFPIDKKPVSEAELQAALFDHDPESRMRRYREFERRNMENPFVLPIRTAGSTFVLKKPLRLAEGKSFDWGIQLWWLETDAP